MNTNNFWHQRILQMTIIVSFIIIVLFAATNFLVAPETIPPLQVAPFAAILAAITLLVAGLSFVTLPQKVQAALPVAAQLLLIITTGALIHTSGGAESHYIPLWIPAIIFVSAFGTVGLLGAALIPVGYALWLALTGTITTPTVLSLLLLGELPLLISYLLHSHLDANGEDSSYKQLASQFSQVSGKSDVVITAISNGVIALDNQGVIELINPAAQRLIGWESHDALKLDYKSVLKLLDNESKELTPANDPVQKALSTNEEVRTEDFTLVTNSGKKLLISIVASPVGQPGSGIIIVFRDITKEKAEEREQAEFISTASHEMRTPVASIEGYLGLALNPATAQVDEKARSYITKAHEAAQHLGRLFQDLLDTSRAEDGRLSNNPRAVEVVSYAHDIVEGLRPQAEAKGLVLVYKPMPDGETDDKSNRRLNPVFYANVDNDHLREVIGNLVENAIKYTKQGTISVDIGGDEKQIEISIQDTGIGIPSEDLSHLFQKFYRVDNTDTREIGGTGLGLYLSRRRAEAMEGRIWAESQNGQGSTFFVSIPRISHQEAMQLIETLSDETTQSIGQATFQEPAAQPEPAPLAAPETLTTPAVQPVTESSVGGVFVNPPAEAIAAQLAAAPATPPQTPVQTPQFAPPGPSLATIEQDPRQYIQQASTQPAPSANSMSPVPTIQAPAAPMPAAQPQPPIAQQPAAPAANPPVQPPEYHNQA